MLLSETEQGGGYGWGRGHVDKCAPEKAKYAWKCISICACNIFKHATDVWNISSRVPQSTDQRWLLIWNVVSIQSVFFPCGMVQLLWIFQGTFNILFLVCLPHAQQFLKFYCFTQYSPKTENWSNFYFFYLFLKSFSPQFGFKNSDNWTTWKNRLKIMRGGQLV